MSRPDLSPGALTLIASGQAEGPGQPTCAISSKQMQQPTLHPSSCSHLHTKKHCQEKHTRLAATFHRVSFSCSSSTTLRDQGAEHRTKITSNGTHTVLTLSFTTPSRTASTSPWPKQYTEHTSSTSTSQQNALHFLCSEGSTAFPFNMTSTKLLL